jgi:hypothetical protein
VVLNSLKCLKNKKNNKVKSHCVSYYAVVETWDELKSKEEITSKEVCATKNVFGNKR